MRPSVLLAIAISLVSLGCVQVTDFDPVGHAASVSGAWTIDGALPSPESCALLGANVVRVTFLDGLRPVVHGALVFPCASSCMPDGTPECFRSGVVVAEGTWTVRLEAASGTVRVAAGPEQTIEATPEGHVVLDTVAFYTARIDALFTVNGSEPTRESCDGVGIAAVELAFLAAGGAIAGAAAEPCPVGAVGVRVEPGSYTVALRALGPGGEVIVETVPETFELEPGEHATLAGGEAIDLP